MDHLSDTPTHIKKILDASYQQIPPKPKLFHNLKKSKPKFFLNLCWSILEL